MSEILNGEVNSIYNNLISGGLSNIKSYQSGLKPVSSIMNSFAPTASTPIGKIPIPASPTIMQQTKIVSKMDELTRKQNSNHDSQVDRTQTLFSQIQYLLGDISKTANEQVQIPGVVNTLNIQLYHFKVHLDGLLDYVRNREQQTRIAESKFADLRREINVNRNSSQLEDPSELVISDDVEDTPLKRTSNAHESHKKKIESSIENSTQVPMETDARFSSSMPDKRKNKKNKRSKKRESDQGVDEKSDSEKKELVMYDSSQGSTEPETEEPYSSRHKAKRSSISPTQSSLTVNKRKRAKLPDSATNLLKQWILEHRFHPYPSEEEKILMSNQTHLTINQVNNWFTNARRRFLQKQPNLPEGAQFSSTPSTIFSTSVGSTPPKISAIQNINATPVKVQTATDVTPFPILSTDATQFPILQTQPPSDVGNPIKVEKSEIEPSRETQMEIATPNQEPQLL